MSQYYNSRSCADDQASSITQGDYKKMNATTRALADAARFTTCP